jgi:hypothetical protein
LPGKPEKGGIVWNLAQKAPPISPLNVH